MRSRRTATPEQGYRVIKWRLRNARHAAASARRKRRLRAPAEIGLLDRLRAEVRHAGLRAEPAPDGTALLVYYPHAPLPLWVFVGCGGTRFCWASGQQSHPVADIRGASAALAAYTGTGRQQEAAR